MDTVPYILMQDRLSTRGSFILCDCNATGFPIRYASVGFCELFEYTPMEVKGRKCGDLVAEPNIRANDSGLQMLAVGAGLTPELADAALATITAHIVQECQAIMRSAVQATGFGLVLNRTKTGRLKVIELAMLACRHPTSGWTYCVGLQTDVTEEVPVRALLGAAAEGRSAYASLVKSMEPTMQARLGLLDLRGNAAVQYLDVKATEMWESLMLDALDVEVKPLSAVSEMSTSDEESGEGESDLDTFEDSEAFSRAPTVPKFLWSPLSHLDDLAPVDGWKPQCSEASTAIPECRSGAFSRFMSDDAPSVAESAWEPPAAPEAARPQAAVSRPPAAWLELGEWQFMAGVAVGASCLGAAIACAAAASRLGRCRA